MIVTPNAYNEQLASRPSTGVSHKGNGPIKAKGGSGPPVLTPESIKRVEGFAVKLKTIFEGL